MWMKSIVLTTLLGLAALQHAHAQSVDPNPANRGFPAYAEPGFSGYYNGVPQGGAAATAEEISKPAALPKRRKTR